MKIGVTREYRVDVPEEGTDAYEALVVRWIADDPDTMIDIMTDNELSEQAKIELVYQNLADIMVEGFHVGNFTDAVELIDGDSYIIGELS
jgi:regulator of replication initiation timing